MKELVTASEALGYVECRAAQQTIINLTTRLTVGLEALKVNAPIQEDQRNLKLLGDA